MDPIMKVVAIVQARMGSTRLPNKVMKPILGIPMIELLLNRLSKAEGISQIVVATSTNVKNDVLEEHVSKLGFQVFRGDEDDVLQRFVDAARYTNADVVVRITGDCPLVDPILVNSCVAEFKIRNVDYLSNTNPPTYPDGLDIEVFTRKALEQCIKLTDAPFDHEHVTPFIRSSNLFTKY
jgi:glutamate-1-semialdehyde 2,1-aminomutase